MKKLLLLLFAASPIFCFSQKQRLTDSSYKSWVYIDQGYTRLHPTGRYFHYQIKNKPLGSFTFVIAATDHSWQKEIPALQDFNYTAEGDVFIYMQGDTLQKLNLTNKQLRSTPDCKGFTLYQQGKNEWLIYQLKGSASVLRVENLQTGKLQSYPDVTDYTTDPNHPVLLLSTKVTTDQEQLTWLDLSTGQRKQIYKGLPVNRPTFDRSGRKLAFYTLNEGNTSIWYYEAKQGAAKALANDSSVGIAKGSVIATDIWKFSTDGADLFFNQSDKMDLSNSNDPAVWSYQDGVIYPAYNPGAAANGRNFSAFNIATGKVKQLLSGAWKVVNPDHSNSDVLIVENTFGPADELPWNVYSKISYALLFTKTGELRPIKEHAIKPLRRLELSPDNRLLTYYDLDQQSYFAYDLISKNTVAINKLKGGASYHSNYSRNDDDNDPAGIVCWIDGSQRAIVQGRYDLWDVDFSGKNALINLTQIGADQGIIFSLNEKPATRNAVLSPVVWLTGFKLADKSYGLYTLNLRSRDLQCKYVNHTAGRPYGQVSMYFNSASGILMANQTAASAINYSFTKDFKTVKPLTDVHPEQDYQWMTAELLSYKDKSGKPCEAILYKPDLVDSNKKYPVIFRYYMDESDRINDFILPLPNSEGFNIPLLVSRGYMVVIPTIYRERGKPGESALNSVNAAADCVSKFRWADTLNMGISGHSYGGLETNYIVTHTDRFKAAFSSAGVSNLISGYNDLWPNAGSSKQGYLKYGPPGMTGGLENHLEEYLNNSPIVSSANVTTPILLLHNMKDESVPVANSIQFFVQLRSLNKPVWLIQYDREGHILYQEKNRLDFQRKVGDFFDHYLKGEPMPNWMKKHISPKVD